ncbi:MAG: TIGR01777 family protein [Candidatus Omnitrophica bacterium]|nr:TIGR01777 family protein [Candidatus Omnitrophota bacterium]
MKIVGAGISGLIGASLSRALLEKYEVVRLKRAGAIHERPFGFSREAVWDPSRGGDWVKELDGAYGVVNLCGEPIAAKRWTAKQKERIRESRLLTTKAIVDAIGEAAVKPKVLVNASAVGFYGPRGEGETLNEDAPAGSGFLADVCKEWENQAQRARSFGTRVVLLRTGIVLSREGGALSKLLPPFRFFLGGPLGSGKQTVSWVHLQDEVRAILKVLEDPAVEGPVNVAAPHPVSMRELAETMGRVLHRPSFFSVPGFVLRTLLGEMAEMLLEGQKAYPRKLAAAGFQFKFETLETALRDLLK